MATDKHDPADAAGAAMRNFDVDVSRRRLMQGIGVASALGSLGIGGEAQAQATQGVTLALTRGAYGNNGATPWYATLPLGSGFQPLKFALDSGTNFSWVTSSLCAPAGCVHAGNDRFQASPDYTTTLQWLDRTNRPVSFGPWGTMTVQRASDELRFPQVSAPQRTAMLLAADYSGPQFAQIAWDGGLALPSGSAFVEPGVSFIVADLINRGAVSPNYPYIAFNTDRTARTGTCQIGGVDPSKFDPSEGIRIPWQQYTAYPDVGYLWSGALASFTVGQTTVASNAVFCLDSGSSRFKGDDGIMKQTLAIIAAQPSANVVIYTGLTNDGQPGRITVTPSMYNAVIEIGPDTGRSLPQFNPLGLTNLALVGSTLMDHFYTIFEYRVLPSPVGYQLHPAAMWLFAKSNGIRGLLPRSRVPWIVGKAKPIGS